MLSQLTYNSRNLIGNGSTERRDEGLSDFGVAIVERMNRTGMAVDVHPQRMFDVAEALIRRKDSDRNVELVLGGNFKRVLSEIWKREPVDPGTKPK
jgi:microsomal dipeptidase-like Zn-dependent dipeptidase